MRTSSKVAPSCTRRAASAGSTQATIGGLSTASKASFDSFINRPPCIMRTVALRGEFDNSASSPKASPSRR